MNDTRALLLHGAILESFDAPVSGDSLLVENGRIVAMASLAELRALSPQAEPVDLSGSVLRPGFVDTHTHFFEYARRLAGVDLSPACDLDDVRAVLRAYRERMHAGQFWIGGGGWDRELYPRAEEFNRHLLDEIFPEHPIALESRDFHTLICNTLALQEAGVFSGTPAPPGGEIGRGPDGEPDGYLYETAWDLVWNARPVESEELRALWAKRAIAAFHGLGLTGFHSMEVDAALATYERLRDRGELGLRVCFHSPSNTLDARIESGRPSYVGDDPWIRLGGVKIFMDGSLGSRSAYMLEPYPDGSRGRLLREGEELLELVLRAGRAGIAPTVHAIGDATVRLVIDVANEARRVLRGEGIDDSRWLFRMEHAQCVRPADIPRLAAERIYCAVQPVHLGDDVDLMRSYWPQAGRHAYPLRAMLDAGVTLGMGSDVPVATPDPRAGVHAAIARRKGNDPALESWHEEQALRVEEALAGYTIGAARGAGWEDRFGSLRVGKYADLVAVDIVPKDEPGAWLDARIRLTVVDGRIVYEDLASRP